MKSLSPLELKDFDASLKGGRKTKRRGNASLRAWVTFVKKVAKEEKLSYKDAMMRAKARKDKGEKWMKGGNEMSDMMVRDEMAVEEDMEMPLVEEEMDMDMDVAMEKPEMGGRRHRRKGKSHKKHGGAKKRGTKKRR
jgi:hypothetical protein